MAAKTQSKGKSVESPAKCATSAECEVCLNQCPNGKAHLNRLKNKHQSSCPVCPLKK